MARADVTIAESAGVIQYTGAGTDWFVKADNGALYFIYADSGSDVAFRKSTNGGLTWSAPVIIFAGSISSIALWYDRWSGLSSDLIHVVWQEIGGDDTFYRTINTASSDALSTQTTIQLGTTTAAGGCLSVTRSVGGNVYCATMIDAGAEGGFYRLPNANVPDGAWDAARTTVFEGATQDQIILAPDLTAADNQDIIAIFWDASNNEISRKLYDDSANTWGETSISTGMVDISSTNGFPNFDLTVDLDNSKLVLVAWNGVDTAGADLMAWDITNSSITALTDVVSNGTDDQGLCSIALDTDNGDLYVFYCGKSDGSETWNTSINIYYKKSTDGGATWGTETLCTNAARDIGYIVSSMRDTLPDVLAVGFHNDLTRDELMVSLELPSGGGTTGGRILIT
jgi:hypothetical protein